MIFRNEKNKDYRENIFRINCLTNDAIKYLFIFKLKLTMKQLPALHSHIDQTEVETDGDQSNDGCMVKPYIGQTESCPIENIVKIELK